MVAGAMLTDKAMVAQGCQPLTKLLTVARRMIYQ